MATPSVKTASDATGPRQAGPEERGGAVDLPLLVVDRDGAPPMAGRALSRLWTMPKVVGSLALALVLLAVGAIGGLYFEPRGLADLVGRLDFGSTPEIAVRAPDAAASETGEGGGLGVPPPPSVVLGLGRLVPEGFVVTVAPPFGAGDARIAELRVREGDKVQGGEVLAVLDNRASLAAAVETARAEVAQREAELAQTRHSIRASLAESRAALARAGARADNAAREFDRAKELVGRGHVTKATFDERRAAHEQAQREVEQAEATLSRYDAGDLEAQADVLVARSNLQAAEARLAAADSDLDKAFVRAPADGTVLTIHAWPGEKPGAEGLLNLGDIDDMIAEVEIYQTQIGTVAVGDPVEITADALPRPLTGRVDRIGWEVGRQTVTDADPAANTDARVVKVYVALDAASRTAARRLTNLQVTARITTGPTS